MTAKMVKAVQWWLEMAGLPEHGIVQTPCPDGTCSRVGGDDLENNGAIGTQDLHPGLHVHRKLLVAANTEFEIFSPQVLDGKSGEGMRQYHESCLLPMGQSTEYSYWG